MTRAITRTETHAMRTTAPLARSRITTSSTPPGLTGDRRAAEPVVRRPADDSRQFELGAGLGVQSRRGRRYPLRGPAAAKLEKPHVGQPVRRCMLPGVSLASGLFERRGFVPRREPQGARLDRPDRLQVDRTRAIEARDPVPEHAAR